MKIIDISNCNDEVIMYINNLQNQLQQKENIIKEIKEYNEKIIEEGWYGGFEKDNAKHNLEILDKKVN